MWYNVSIFRDATSKTVCLWCEIGLWPGYIFDLNECAYAKTIDYCIEIIQFVIAHGIAMCMLCTYHLILLTSLYTLHIYLPLCLLLNFCCLLFVNVNNIHIIKLCVCRMKKKMLGGQAPNNKTFHCYFAYNLDLNIIGNTLSCTTNLLDIHWLVDIDTMMLFIVRKMFIFNV